MKFPRPFFCLGAALFLLVSIVRGEEGRELIIESLTGQSEVVIDYKNNLGWGTNGTYVINRALVTTDDVEEPAYEIRARSIKIREGKSIEARNATLFIGNVPVMFFPYYNRSLVRHPNNWVLTPGYRSLYGPYLL